MTVRLEPSKRKDLINGNLRIAGLECQNLSIKTTRPAKPTTMFRPAQTFQQYAPDADDQLFTPKPTAQPKMPFAIGATGKVISAVVAFSKKLNTVEAEGHLNGTYLDSVSSTKELV